MKDSSKSTSEGEWEMRDGKWYRRDYYAIKPGEQQKQTVRVKCPNCPVLQEKIAALTRERDELRRLLQERDRLIAQLKQRIAQLEAESNAKNARIAELEAKLRDALSQQETLRVTIREKETIIMRLEARIKQLMDELAQKQAMIDELLRIRRDLEARISKLLADLSRFEDQSKLIALLEEQIAYCKAHHHASRQVVQTVAEPVRWYYAVQTPQHAQLFQMHQAYLGGDIVVDSLEGATIVNPEYYSQSERVAGNSRLRIRVVTALVPGQLAPGQELFVRLRLGSATQFTQPRPVSPQAIAWHQDFVFVGVPTHPSSQGVLISAHPLGIEVVSRVIGSAGEQVVASGTVDLSDLVLGLTRQELLNLSPSGSINLRIKALDFGLPAPLTGSTTTVITVDGVDTSQDVFALRKADLMERMEIEDEQRGLYERMLGMHRSRLTSTTSVTRPKTTSITRTAYYVSNEDAARRLDAADGVIDGKYKGAEIHRSTLSGEPALSATSTQKTTYYINDEEARRKLDAADGVMDGKYKGADIRAGTTMGSH